VNNETSYNLNVNNFNLINIKECNIMLFNKNYIEQNEHALDKIDILDKYINNTVKGINKIK
jgi:hypothetical protein